MKTKIKIKKIEDADIDVPVNSPEHRIWEIKREIQENTPEEEEMKVEVFEMWGK